MAKVGKTLITVGFLIFGGAVAWWFLFFEQYFGGDVKRASECFYFTSDSCSLGHTVEFVGSVPAYSPVALWVAASIFVIGVVLLSLAPLRR
ncbi:MAG: hypothetical protein IPM60_01835 [Rhodospirillales bacterium]|nr:hypothetical protein [Rhodospirillales bacterium]